MGHSSVFELVQTAVPQQNYFHVALDLLRNIPDYQKPHDWEIDDDPQFRKESREALGSVPYNSMTSLANPDAVAVLSVLLVILLQKSIIFRILVAHARRVGRFDNIRFENRYQLDNMPISDIPYLKTLEDQRGYISSLTPEKILRDRPRLFVDVWSYRKEDDTIFINLPVVVTTMSKMECLQFLNLLVKKLASVWLNFVDFKRGRVSSDIPRRLSDAILEEVCLGYGLVETARRVRDIAAFGHDEFLVSAMSDDRAYEFIERIAVLAFQVDFVESYYGQVMRGKRRYDVLYVNEDSWDRNVLRQYMGKFSIFFQEFITRLT